MTKETEKQNTRIRPYKTTGLVALAAAGIALLGSIYTEKQAERREQLGTYTESQETVQEGYVAYPDFDDFVDNFDYVPKDAEPITDKFIASLQMRESTNNPRAISPKGARGLMQIMKPTWNEVTEELYGKELNYDKAFDPKINREVGIAYLNKIDNILASKLEGYVSMPKIEKQKRIAAAYNGGITRLLKNKGDVSKMFKETRDYVPAVTNNL